MNASTLNNFISYLSNSILLFSYFDQYISGLADFLGFG
jgi:hypothetical protein